MRLKLLLGPLPNPESSAAITLLFFLLFLGLCRSVYRRDREKLYQKLAALPFAEDEHE